MEGKVWEYLHSQDMANRETKSNQTVEQQEKDRTPTREQAKGIYGQMTDEILKLISNQTNAIKIMDITNYTHRNRGIIER